MTPLSEILEASFSSLNLFIEMQIQIFAYIMPLLWGIAAVAALYDILKAMPQIKEDLREPRHGILDEFAIGVILPAFMYPVFVVIYFFFPVIWMFKFIRGNVT